MAELPTEIIAKILSKLPVKSLLRFQCVSKSWQSLINSHDFAKSHLNQTLISDSHHRHLLVSVNHSSFHTSELNLFNNQLSLSFSELRHHPLKRRQPFNLVGSCNGVICVSNLNKVDVFLFNPLTNSHRKLPYNDVSFPNLNRTVFGFGYDRENEDYKVLRISQGLENIEDSKNKVEVYSLKSNSWKCTKGIQNFFYYGYYHGVLVNEGLHYLVTNKEFDSESLSIAKFDLQNDSISLMCCPNDGNFDIYSANLEIMLTELDGCLCLLINYYTCDAIDDDEIFYSDDFHDVGFDSGILDLWVMKEYGNALSWVKLFSIRQPREMGSYIFIRTVVWLKDGRRILLEIDGSGYCWYDLELKNVERVTAHGLPEGNYLSGTFVGSLVSVEDKLQSEKKTLPKKNKRKQRC